MNTNAIVRLMSIHPEAGPVGKLIHDTMLVVPYVDDDTINALKRIAQSMTVAGTGGGNWWYEPLYWRNDGRGSVAYKNAEFQGMARWQISVWDLPPIEFALEAENIIEAASR